MHAVRQSASSLFVFLQVSSQASAECSRCTFASGDAAGNPELVAHQLGSDYQDLFSLERSGAVIGMVNMEYPARGHAGR